MRVSFNYDVILGAYRLLIGGSMAIVGAPVALLVGLSGHPDAFFMMLVTLLLAFVLGSSIWLFMLVTEILRLAVIFVVLLLHGAGQWLLRGLRG